LTFLWAGAGKLTQQMTPSPAQAARLAAWGVIAAPQSSEPPSAAPPTQPGLEPNVLPEVEPEPESLEQLPPGGTSGLATDGVVTPAGWSAEQTTTVRRLYGLALLIDAAASPPLERPNGMTLVPDAAATGRLPVYLAWTAAAVEVAAGAAVLIGFFTRLAALPLALTMVTALWLTQIGPAVQSGSAVLGFLPTGVFALQADSDYAYGQLLWQLALLLMALALVCVGPGALSLDRIVFGPVRPRRAPQPEPAAAEPPVELVPIRAVRPASKPTAQGIDD
jgi:uncharacterized membrane protein YphA (DoxX/SURF4 family)